MKHGPLATCNPDLKGCSLQCLSQFQLVDFNISAEAPILGATIAPAMKTARKAVDIFKRSTELRQLSFTTGTVDNYYTAGMVDKYYKEFKAKVREVRREATREGVKSRQSALQRELSYASRAIELMECEFELLEAGLRV